MEQLVSRSVGWWVVGKPDFTYLLCVCVGVLLMSRRRVTGMVQWDLRGSDIATSMDQCWAHESDSLPEGSLAGSRLPQPRGKHIVELCLRFFLQDGAAMHIKRGVDVQWGFILSTSALVNAKGSRSGCAI